MSEPGLHENTAEVCLVNAGRIRLTVQGVSHERTPDMAVCYKALHENRIEILKDANFFLIHHNWF